MLSTSPVCNIRWSWLQKIMSKLKEPTACSLVITMPTVVLAESDPGVCVAKEMKTL